MTTIDLTVNGRRVSGDVEPRTHLADFLRDSENLTGTHLGCEHGVCGACTVLVDGVPARSCITYAVACSGADVTTVEGLDDDEIGRELRTAFSREHALQCGFCTPGMLVSARDLVLRLDAPDEQAIRVAMSGNLCRCTGYVGIVRAVRSVISERRARGIAAVPGASRDRLGPAGSGHAAAQAAKGAEAPQASRSAGARREPAPAVPHDPDWTPQTSFTRSFLVKHPPEEVWRFFGRVSEVAACLPGASLDGEPEEGHVEGRMRVKAGPMSAEFAGSADIARNDDTRTGTILGAGRDQRSNSATRGRIAYAVKPGTTPSETEVALEIGYTLTGMLAQFNRSGLVRDVADRLIALFVQNLEARLSGREDGGAAPASGELNAASLVWGVIRQRAARLAAALFRRK